MKREPLQLNKIRCAGFTLLEPLLAGATFSLAALTIVTGFVAGQRGIAAVEERSRALFLAQEGVEIVRNFRDGSFDALIEGTWGLASEGGGWELAEAPDTTDDFYTREITITAPEEDRRDITVRVSWVTEFRTGEVELQEILTDWH